MIDYSKLPEGYMESVRAFAKERGIEAKLQERLDYLDTYACRFDDGEGNEGVDRERTKCVLYKDFAPYSFEFVMLKVKDSGGTRLLEPWMWFNGGLIYHGQGSSGAEFPELSVRLGDTDEDWGIHT